LSAAFPPGLAGSGEKNYNGWKDLFNRKDGMSRTAEVTELLRAWGQGDQAALDRLTPLVYGELHRMAHRYMRNERGGNTLQTTALVNEAYLRLVGVKGALWQDRAHFFALSAQTMRRILVDGARARVSAKRGGGKRADHSGAIDLDAIPDVGSQKEPALIALDDALNELATIDPRKARVIELRFFGGLSVEETARVLNLSPQSILRDWKFGKAWLQREMAG
jgi:RNA polymerase sigma factor (TIGR02999 family)